MWIDVDRQMDVDVEVYTTDEKYAKQGYQAGNPVPKTGRRCKCEKIKENKWCAACEATKRCVMSSLMLVYNDDWFRRGKR